MSGLQRDHVAVRAEHREPRAPGRAEAAPVEGHQIVRAVDELGARELRELQVLAELAGFLLELPRAPVEGQHPVAVLRRRGVQPDEQRHQVVVDRDLADAGVGLRAGDHLAGAEDELATNSDLARTPVGVGPPELVELLGARVQVRREHDAAPSGERDGLARDELQELVRVERLALARVLVELVLRDRRLHAVRGVRRLGADADRGVARIVVGERPGEGRLDDLRPDVHRALRADLVLLHGEGERVADLDDVGARHFRRQ
ncbi:MAG: hypothetical protein KF894_29575 [Labilithrix sp.]|nr:hypothetical protein [Labilithrix sp.]